MQSCAGHRRSRSGHWAAIVVLFGLAALAPRASHAQAFVPGDVNNDGSFNVVDSTVLRRALLLQAPGITQTCILLPGDVNSDSSFNATDVTVVRAALVGLPPGFSQTCNGAPADTDGFEVVDGDCDNTNPFVNPAAFDFVGNGLDDDCDGMYDEPRVTCDGSLPSNATAPASYAQAMDLCATAVESPPLNARTWGLISGAFTLASDTGTPSTLARSVRSLFGVNNPKRFGGAMAVLSTGNAAATGQVSPPHVAFQLGTSFGSTSVLPSDWLASHGGVPPVAPGCPVAPDVTGRDSTMLRLRLRVPSNARSFRLSTKHLSADYPEYVCSPFNDYLVVLLGSSFAGAPANPADKNLASVANIAGPFPVGANLATGSSGLYRDCLNGVTGCANDAIPGAYVGCTGTSGLTGTGMDVLNPPGFEGDAASCGASNMTGGATAWLAIQGNVVPDEIIEIRIAVWDSGDPLWDSVVLLDDFRWSATLIQPGAIAN